MKPQQKLLLLKHLKTLQAQIWGYTAMGLLTETVVIILRIYLPARMATAKSTCTFSGKDAKRPRSTGMFLAASACASASAFRRAFAAARNDYRRELYLLGKTQAATNAEMHETNAATMLIFSILL